MLKTIFSRFSFCFTEMALLWMISNARNPDVITVQYLYAFAIASLFGAVFSVVFYKKRVSYPAAWARRVLILVLTMIVLGITLQLFGIISYPTAMGYIRFYLRATLGALGGATVLWVIIDLLQRRALAKINERLKNNEDE